MATAPKPEGDLMPDKFAEGEHCMWNSSARGWVEVIVVRKSREHANHWVVLDTTMAHRQERIYENRMMNMTEWGFSQSLKGIQ
jgi:hypothetical protein